MEDGAVVGVLGVLCTTLLGVVGIFLSYRAKNQPFRQVLYERQIELLLAAAVQADELHSRCIAVAYNKNPTRQGELLADLRKKGREFSSTLARVGAILPLEVWDAYVSYQESAAAFTANPKDLFPHVDDRFIRLVGPTRRFLGVDPLSEENVKHFGERKRDVASLGGLTGR